MNLTAAATAGFMSWPGKSNLCFQARTFLLELGRETTVRDDQVVVLCRRSRIEESPVNPVR